MNPEDIDFHEIHERERKIIYKYFDEKFKKHKLENDHMPTDAETLAFLDEFAYPPEKHGRMYNMLLTFRNAWWPKERARVLLQVVTYREFVKQVF